MNSKTNFLIILVFSVVLTPVLVSADGGMVIWPPDVYLDQSAQNAIVAWNGEEEIIILSNDVESNAMATVLRMIPLPSDPTEIKEGSFESFEKLVELMNEKLEATRTEWQALGKGAEAPAAGVEITFQQQIGAHDVTVVKVSNLDDFLDWIASFAQAKELGLKEISSEFKQGVENYLKRDIKYFVFDVIEAGIEKESIKPLIYKFDSDYLFYPLLITGISEVGQSEADLQIFLITDDKKEKTYWREFGYPVELTLEELGQVSEDIASLFDGGARARSFDYYGRFEEIEMDLMVYPQIWERDLSIGSRGEDVRALQKILINEGVWDSKVEATGYFGPITESSLIKFQEKYKWEIFKAPDLETEIGYFDEQTRDYLEKLSIDIEKVEEEIKWDRNLAVGIRGDDVKVLQEILISEGVWTRPDIGATGYFGPITKQAVIAFQERHSSEILEPLGLEKGTGFFGPSTRNYLERLR